MTKLEAKLLQEIRKGSTNNMLYDVAVMNGYDGTRKNFKDYIRRFRDKNGIKRQTNTTQSLDYFIKVLEDNGPMKVLDLCRMFDCSPDNIDAKIKSLRSEGNEVVCDDHIVFISKITNGSTAEKIETPLEDRSIIFGVASDLHIGSKAAQLTALNEFCERCRSRGVKHIFVPGDVFSGLNVYPGHIYDVYAVSAEDQINSAIRNIPEGFNWIIMGGNHDASFTSRGGVNPLEILAAKRPDIHYVGFDDVNVPILKNVDLKMIHPSGGGNYAYSYKLQKSIEKVAYNELKNMIDDSEDNSRIRFLLAGHLHIQMQAMFGGIFGAQCGCFEGETSYIMRKGLNPPVGGYIIDANLDSDGFLRDFEARFHLFNEIVDDWKNYKHSTNFAESSITEPIFETPKPKKIFD